MDVKVIDNDGVWYINRSQFRHVDPGTNIIFEPSLPTRVTPTVWLQDQPMMETVDDPFTGAAPSVLKGEQVLRENPDNVAGNADAAGAAAASQKGSGKK